MAERVFPLPDLGEGLEEATVSAWLVAEGDTVSLNQPFVEIETAKAMVEVPAPFAGRVARLHVAAGETLAVGAPLATFEVEGAAGGTSVTAAPVTATPAVRKLARDLGVDLSMVSGSGPGGRVTREDVESLARSGLAASYPATLPGGEPATARTVISNTSSEEIPVSPIRRAVAERLSEVAAIPQVTTFRTVECTAIDAVRRELGVSPLPVFVRALCEVVKDHPMLNATWTDQALLVHDKVNVGIATDTERGLVVPVVMDAGSLGIGEIASEIDRLARAARQGSLKPTDTSGETIAVTNTGSYGSEFGTPLLNPGHAVTIALGVIAPKALVIDGAVEARPACTLSLTFDHRVLDGATVGRAFGALVELLELRERLDTLPR
ncbi:MAG TPA: dihydrolipoamide acetyltransferase family protein [Actinomycetota bacterium]|nr:dihydrolipoamide acetyltransferase family protein [Actinomycetota bacterium]